MTEFFNRLDVDGMLELLVRIAAVFVCIVIHEVSHGLAAYKLGDPTAKQGHRLSLNPIRHIDPVGLLMMIVAGFGWAKPVPVNPNYFKNPKSGMALTALAGPASNFVLAFVTAFCYSALVALLIRSYSEVLYWFAYFFGEITVMSIGLGIFNLIPFPPLDGSKILSAVLPEALYFRIMHYERYGMIILFAVLWFGFLDTPLKVARDFVLGIVFGASAFLIP